MSLSFSRSTKISLGLLAVALLVAAVGWFVMVKPVKAEAADATAETVELQDQLASLQAQLTALQEQPQDSVPDFFRLSKAAPVNIDLPGANIELLAVADRAGVEIRSFQQSEIAERGDFAAPTFTVILRGGMDEIVDYFKRLRQLVVVRSGNVNARGNLYRIEQFDIIRTDLPEGVLEGTVTMSITAPAGAGTDEEPAAAAGGDNPEGDAPEGDAPSEDSPPEGADG